MDMKTSEEQSRRSQPEEGRFTRMVEKTTAQVPSIGFLALAGASILLSMGFKARNQDGAANFVGLWTPTILLIGIYNKLVKIEGSDHREKGMLH